MEKFCHQNNITLAVFSTSECLRTAFYYKQVDFKWRITPEQQRSRIWIVCLEKILEP